MNDGILKGEKENRIDFKATVRMSLCCTRQHHIVLRDSEINRDILQQRNQFSKKTQPLTHMYLTIKEELVKLQGEVDESKNHKTTKNYLILSK